MEGGGRMREKGIREEYSFYRRDSACGRIVWRNGVGVHVSHEVSRFSASQ